MPSQRATSSAGQNGGRNPALPLPPSGQTHYQLLELTPGATTTELRQAFRSLSKRYHPDTTTLPPAEAREAFARLRQAYAVLADPASRRAYDALLRAPAEAPLRMVSPPPSGPAAAPRPIGVRRSLSGGEWFALVLLGLALALSLVLGVGLAWVRGAALVTRPSWWIEEPLATVPRGGSPEVGVPSMAGAQGPAERLGSASAAAHRAGDQPAGEQRASSAQAPALEAPSPPSSDRAPAGGLASGPVRSDAASAPSQTAPVPGASVPGHSVPTATIPNHTVAGEAVPIASSPPSAVRPPSSGGVPSPSGPSPRASSLASPSSGSQGAS